MKNKGIVFRYIWRYKFRYLIGLVTLFLVDYFNLNIPQIIGEITDGLVAYSLDINGLIALIIKLLVIVLIYSQVWNYKFFKIAFKFIFISLN